jgi:hypothetical protein
MVNIYKFNAVYFMNFVQRFLGNDISLEVKFEDLIIGKKIGQGSCSSGFIDSPF